ARAWKTIAEAMPCPWAVGATATRRRNRVRPIGSRISPPAGRPSTSARTPPCSASAAARDSGVSDSASAGGSRAGRAANAAITTSWRWAASSTPAVRTVSTSGAGTRGGRDQLIESGIDLTVALHHDQVAGPGALDEDRTGDPRLELAAVAHRGEPVAGPADDRRRHVRERAERD